ncbi:MAG: hypothetical protein WAU88_12275 [Candidatus Zixiibacteriota bacterium]
MKISRVLLMGSVLLLGIMFVTPKLQTQDATPKPTTLVVDWGKHGKPVYTIDGHLVGHEALDDLLYDLAQVYNKFGRAHPINVFIDNRLPFSTIGNVEGTAGKAQLDSLRYFVFNKESGYMCEPVMEHCVKYSTTDVPSRSEASR